MDQQSMYICKRLLLKSVSSKAGSSSVSSLSDDSFPASVPLLMCVCDLQPVTGNVVLCEHGRRRVSMYNRETGKRHTIVDNLDDDWLNSPNDLVFGANGDLYFTDPRYLYDSSLRECIDDCC